jgi:hypothetical protein
VEVDYHIDVSDNDDDGVYPDELKQAIRRRFPSPDAGSGDDEFAAAGRRVYNVTWQDLIIAKWPVPLKSCGLCRCSTGERKPSQLFFGNVNRQREVE